MATAQSASPHLAPTTWYPSMGVFSGASSRSIFYSGGSAVTDTTALAGGFTLNTIGLGGLASFG